MIFQQILLKVLSILNNERTVSSAYHLFRGKRSGQTIQDVGMFKLHAYFGILPKLNRKQFDAAVEELSQQGYLTVFEDGFYKMNGDYQGEILPFLNGWHYRGNEHLFFSRLALTIETMSYAKNQISYFAPTEKNVEVQQFVRSFLTQHPFKTSTFRKQLLDEIQHTLEEAPISDLQRDIVVARLSGVNIAGITWQQLASRYKMSEMDSIIYYISALHAMLHTIEEKGCPLLLQLAHGTKITTPLTDSARHTAHLMKEGYSLEQIASMRQLKVNTIEDHIVEIAMNDPSFALHAFITKEDLQTVIEASDTYQTKKLRVLKEVVPNLSYFQIRLALARGEV